MTDPQENTRMLNKSPFGKREDAEPLASPARTPTPFGSGMAMSPRPLQDTPAVRPAVTESAPAETQGSRLVVGPSVKLRGAEITDCDTLVVEGRVEATLDSRVIQIADRGAFSGKVSIDVAEIRGCFEGELTARKQLVIHSTGRVNGIIRYGKIVIEEGGEVTGDVRSMAIESRATSAGGADLVDLAGVAKAAVVG